MYTVTSCLETHPKDMITLMHTEFVNSPGGAFFVAHSMLDIFSFTLKKFHFTTTTFCMRRLVETLVVKTKLLLVKEIMSKLSLT